MPQDIEMAVLGAHFVPGVVRTVPLIENVLDPILALLHAEADWPLLGLVGGITLYVNSHTEIVAPVSLTGQAKSFREIKSSGCDRLRVWEEAAQDGSVPCGIHDRFPQL
jgi:hypothetical protein